MTKKKSIPFGAFIRVRSDHATHAGKDAMLHADFNDGTVGLIFGFDRHDRGQEIECVGPELWDKADLDLSTVEV
jgi:hypothetical protein